MKGLYAFGCPLARYTGNTASKIGITGSWWARLSAYQSAVSKLNHTACFELVYIGPNNAIENLEAVIKTRYNWSIASDRGGESEWLDNFSVTEIETIIDDIIDSFKFKVTKVDTKWLPLTKDNMADFLATYQNS